MNTTITRKLELLAMTLGSLWIGSCILGCVISGSGSLHMKIAGQEVVNVSFDTGVGAAEGNVAPKTQ